MRCIPTLYEVGRRYLLNTLHMHGNDRRLAAKPLACSDSAKAAASEETKFAGPVSLARDDGCGEVNGAVPGTELSEHETASVNVIEELISLVEAIGERVQRGDVASQTTPREQKI